jgi:glucose-6-phosphate isomerase
MPESVGGRYSVFSTVGLFPLALLGIDCAKLLDGAAHMRAACLREGANPAVVRAAMLFHAKRRGHAIADNFYFKTDLECVGKWYRQLMGESIGKERSADGKSVVHEGMTPTVSIGSTDLHSMAQLYFGGPSDKFFTIITVQKWREDPVTPNYPKYDQLVHNIQRTPLSRIMHAIAESVKTSLRELHKPYCEIVVPQVNEWNIGALLQLHMMEIIYLARLLRVNPFDQPNVETYKIETKRNLARAPSAAKKTT